MALPLLAMAGISAASSLFGQSKQAKEIKKQNKLNLQANRANFIEAERTALGLGIQRAAANRQAVKNLEQIKRSAHGQSGSVTASAAAAGIKGNAVRAVLQSIQSDYSEARYEQEEQFQWQMHDLNMQASNMYRQTAANFAGVTKVPSTRSMITNAVVDTALSVGSQYATQYFQIGAKKK